jgi:hypothetical protein
VIVDGLRLIDTNFRIYPMMCPRSIFLVADGCRTGGSRPDRFSMLVVQPVGSIYFHRFFGQPAQHTVMKLNPALGC